MEEYDRLIEQGLKEYQSTSYELGCISYAQKEIKYCTDILKQGVNSEEIAASVILEDQYNLLSQRYMTLEKMKNKLEKSLEHILKPKRNNDIID